MILEVHTKQVWADYIDGIWINCCEMLRYSVIPTCAKQPGMYNKGNVTALNTTLKYILCALKCVLVLDACLLYIQLQ
jgi:hypothetical protein